MVSAVLYFFQETVIESHSNVLRARYGQTKITGIISMLENWLYTEAPRNVKIK